MAADVNAWRKVVEQVTRGIADEDLQRKAWFGVGPFVSSPEEMINQFFGDAAIEGFLTRDDTGLNGVQIDAGWHLVRLMDDLSKQLPQ